MSVALARELSVNAIILRARAGLSQTALCELAGISRDTLSRIERGDGKDLTKPLRAQTGDGRGQTWQHAN